MKIHGEERGGGGGGERVKWGGGEGEGEGEEALLQEENEEGGDEGRGK